MDYARIKAKKPKDLGAGQQFSAQPKDDAEKTAPVREHGGRPGGYHGKEANKA